MLGIITFIIMIGYLLFQSIEDYKHMQVYVLPNNIVLLFTIGSYLIEKIITTGSLLIPLDVIMTVFGIIILHLFKIYASGDMKALISIFFSLRFVGIPAKSMEPNLFMFLIFILITNTFFSITYIYRRIKNKNNKKTRAAYFPYLTIGYILTLILFTIL